MIVPREILYVTGVAMASLSQGVFEIVLIITVSRATGSTLVMGTLFVATIIPALLLTPLAGVVADRYDRSVVSAAGSVGRLAAVLVLYEMLTVNVRPVGAVLAIVVVNYGFYYLTLPVFDSLAKDTFSPDRLAAGMAWTHGLFQAAAVGSALIAGLVTQYFQTRGSLLLIMALIASSALAFVALRCTGGSAAPRERALVGGAGRGGLYARTLDEIGAGWQHVMASPVRRAMAIVCACVFPVFQAINVLIGPFTYGVLHAGTISLGMIDSAAGAGSVAAAALLLLLRRIGVDSQRTLIVAQVGLILSILAFATARHVALAVGAYACIGLFAGGMRISSRTLIVQLTDGAFAGRTMSLVWVGSLGAGTAAAMIAGAVGQHNIVFAYGLVAMGLLAPLVLTIASRASLEELAGY